MRCRSQTFCWTYPICAWDLPHKDPYDAVKPAVKSPSSPSVHRKGCSGGRTLVFCPSVHRKGSFRGRSAVFCPSVHRKGCFRGRSAVFCPCFHRETVSDGQVFDKGVFSHSLVHAGAEGFSSDGSRSPPELLLSDGRKPVRGPSSKPHFPPLFLKSNTSIVYISDSACTARSQRL